MQAMMKYDSIMIDTKDAPPHQQQCVLKRTYKELTNESNKYFWALFSSTVCTGYRNHFFFQKKVDGSSYLFNVNWHESGLTKIIKECKGINSLKHIITLNTCLAQALISITNEDVDEMMQGRYHNVKHV